MLRSLLLGAVLAITWTLSGDHGRSLGAADKADKVSAPYVHAVIFILKKDAPKEEAKALIADADTLLARIPTVRGMKIGYPADKATPDVAVKDYQVGLLCLFDDFEGLKKYLDHPDHVKYVEMHKKHIDKVLVYDFVQANK